MRLAILLLVPLASPAVADKLLRVGDGQIDGSTLKPYELSWRQCSVQDGQWVSSNDLTESLAVIGEHVLRVQQRSGRADGSRSVSTTFFDRASLAPLRIEQSVFGPDGGSQGRAEHVLTKVGYSGRLSRGGKSKEVAGKVSSTMLHGGAMGLPLALLDYQSGPLQFPASMINFDATYKVTATWAGKEMLDYDGGEVEAWLVDIEWFHEGLGDVYPPGPDASGGRYWVVNDPPPGFPYVPRYKTDTYAVEFVAGTCPEAVAK